MPKNLLYLAENALSPLQGGGIVALAALRGLPPERVLGFYVYTNITPAPEYLERFHALPVLAYGGNPSAHRLPDPPFDPAKPKLARAVIGFRDKLRGAAQALPPPFGGCDWRYVESRLRQAAFRPDIVFAAPLSLRLLQLAVASAEKLRVPLVLLNMDDWISHECARMRPFSGLWQRRIAQVMRAASPHVAYAYSNSERLARRLSDRYAIRHETMNNASDDLLVGRARWSPPPTRPATILTFAGALNWRLQGQTLLRVAEAVAELRFERPIELRIFAPWEFAPFANAIGVPGAVRYCGFLPPHELVEHYLDSDFLVLTTTFVDKEIHLFRHSLATKLSDYLCVGRPVLAVGHPDWAVHDYIEENGCGTAIRTPERGQIRCALARAAVTTPEERERVGRSNRQLWERAHDVRVMAQPVRAILGLDPAG